MYIKLILKILSLFDYFLKIKVINFFKKEKIDQLDIFIDVGSHHGETIKIFNKYFKIKKLFAFEASPINYKVLQKKIKISNYPTVEMYNKALGEKKEKLFLNQFKETQSTTFLSFNQNSKYLIKKKKILSPYSENFFLKKIEIDVERLDEFLQNRNIKVIDILKIDTEGFDFNVIKGLGDKISQTRYIYFEHHFDDMIDKDYKYGDIHRYLIKNNFLKVFKIKMMFRKTFEYIYCNNNL